MRKLDFVIGNFVCFAGTKFLFLVKTTLLVRNFFLRLARKAFFFFFFGVFWANEEQSGRGARDTCLPRCACLALLARFALPFDPLLKREKITPILQAILRVSARCIKHLHIFNQTTLIKLKITVWTDIPQYYYHHYYY